MNMNKNLQFIKNETLKVAHNIKNIQKIRQIKLLSIIHEMMRKGIKKTKREIFYTSPNIFKRQEVVNKMIDNLIKKNNCKLIDFNISASLKGLFFGKIIFKEKNREYVLYKDLIPDMNEIIDIDCGFDSILIVEKDSIMAFMKEVFIRYEIESKCLLVTGKGYPDHNTIYFLAFLEKKGKKIYGFFDLDPHGLNIFKNYKRHIQTIKRIGINSKDVFNYKVNKNDLISMTKRDFKLLKTLEKDSKLQESVIEDVHFLQGLGEKMELEIFTSQDTYFIIDYLKKIEKELI